MKKVIAMVLVLVTLLSLTTTAFASAGEVSNRGNVIYKDSEMTVYSKLKVNSTIIVIEYADRYEITSRDIKTNIITTKIFDKNDNLLDTQTVQIEPQGPEIVPMDYYQHTFSNYEYDVDTSERTPVWTCRRVNDYKYIAPRTPEVNTKVQRWKDHVDNINGLEGDVIIAGGGYIAQTAILALATGGLGAALSYFAAGGAVVAELIELSDALDRADVVFNSL